MGQPPGSLQPFGKPRGRPPPRYFAQVGTIEAVFGFIAVPIGIVAYPEGKGPHLKVAGRFLRRFAYPSRRRGAQGDEVVSKTGDEKAPRRKSDEPKEGGERDVGEALRAVYHDAASEAVPDEMLELLKKLG